MCLSKVTKTVVLKKDIKAKKVVCVKNNKVLSGYTYGIPIKKGLNKDPNKNKISYRYLNGTLDSSYDVGFHFFSIKVPNHLINKVYEIYDEECVIEVTIPKGAKVTYGYQTSDDTKALSLVSNRFILNNSLNDIRNKIKLKK